MDGFTVVDRENLILSLVKGRRVLDLGCADNLHLDAKQRNDRWLHRKICCSASRCVGVDIDEECVNRLREEGYDVRGGDAENLDLDERFEVVVAGELIEHISNVGRLLDSVRRHLGTNGKFIITTPNVFSLAARPGLLRPFMRTGGINPSHVAWYCMTTLRQLLTSNGFEIIRQGFCASRSSSLLKAVFRRVAFRLFPDRAETLFAVCRDGQT